MCLLKTEVTLICKDFEFTKSEKHLLKLIIYWCWFIMFNKLLLK